MERTLLVVVHPLEAVLVVVAGFLAVVCGLRGGTRDGIELGPSAAIIGAIFVIVGGWGVSNIIGEVVPVGAAG